MKEDTTMMCVLKRFAAAGVCIAALAVGGCAKDINARGNLPTDDALAQLEPGQQTRQDVQLIMGTPSHTSMFEQETWYYISAVTTQFAFYSVEEVDRDIYALSFDERGILQDVKTYGLDDAEDIQIVQRETPTMGREYSLIEQLIGNLGRFDRGAPEAGP